MGGFGSSATEGIVEVFNTTSKDWGVICSNSFDIIDAHVICKMLNFETAKVALADGAAADLYGTLPTGSNFILDNLKCDGSESSVWECPLSNEVTEVCVASKAAGVICSESKL